MSLHISRSKALNSISPKKLFQSLENTLKSCEACSNSGKLDNCCESCKIINTAIKRYAESNIPVDYWRLEMKNFKGDTVLANKYNSIVADLNKSYLDGISVCFAGAHGTGKTYTCTNILKRAVERGYQSLYVTLSDIVETLVYGPAAEKYDARRELLMVDFLAIDEFDPRWMPTEQSADLFGRTLENVFRRRTENSMPTLMCTNSPNVIDSFQGQIKQSVESLMNYVEIIPVLGQDFRKVGVE